MHAVFLYHAIRAGLDMGIVNAGMLDVYEEIEPTLKEYVEDVILNRRPDATERLVTFAESFKKKDKAEAKEEAAWRTLPVEERLSHALVKGIVDHIDADTEEARAKYATPLEVIEGPLMRGMSVVGRFVRRGKNVFAAGGEERARDEEVGGVPDAVHGGRKEALGQQAGAGKGAARGR